MFIGYRDTKKGGQAVNIPDQNNKIICLYDNVFFSLKTIKKFNLSVDKILENY